MTGTEIRIIVMYMEVQETRAICKVEGRRLIKFCENIALKTRIGSNSDIIN
jgi:hypothetical protein